jgi:Cu-processing system permease protein
MAAAVLGTSRIVANYIPANFVEGTLLVMLVSLVLLALTIFGSTILQTMANGVVVFMLYGGALLGGLLETLGSVLNINSLINAGVITSLILPSNVIWTLASAVLPPSNAMVVYAVGYVIVLVGLAVLSFRRRDL